MTTISGEILALGFKRQYSFSSITYSYKMGTYYYSSIGPLQKGSALRHPDQAIWEILIRCPLENEIMKNQGSKYLEE